MSGPFKRRSSLKSLPPMGASGELRRRSSLPGVAALLGTSGAAEGAAGAKGERDVPWDLVDRCLLPIIFCHAAAMILSTVLNTLCISTVTSLSLFIWLTISTMAAILCYHNLKVTAAGKAVMLTGCDQPLGYALARRLDEMGFTVFAGCQSATGNRYAESLRDTCSARTHVLQLDVTSENQILAASLYAVEHLPEGAPGIWALVHCAAWMPLGEIEWIPFNIIKKATSINLLGATRLTQVMLPLIRRSRGRVVHLSSILCRAPSPVRGVHSALLSAVETQAACLRRELRSRAVDVVVVATGEYVANTAWLQRDDEAADDVATPDGDNCVKAQAREMWAQLAAEQQTEYGPEYFEAAVRSLEKYTKSYDLETPKVLKSLIDSVVRTFPLAKYTPVSRKEKVQALVADYLPRSVYDIIYT